MDPDYLNKIREFIEAIKPGGRIEIARLAKEPEKFIQGVKEVLRQDDIRNVIFTQDFLFIKKLEDLSTFVNLKRRQTKIQKEANNEQNDVSLTDIN